jgi:hypothetical protein
MVEMVRHLQANGLPAGYLYIMRSQAFGGRREFNEILVGLKQTPDQIQNRLTAPPATGGELATEVPAIGAERPALAAPEPVEVIDAPAQQRPARAARRRPEPKGDPSTGDALRERIKTSKVSLAAVVREVQKRFPDSAGELATVDAIASDPQALDAAMELIEGGKS